MVHRLCSIMDLRRLDLAPLHQGPARMGSLHQGPIALGSIAGNIPSLCFWQDYTSKFPLAAKGWVPYFFLFMATAVVGTFSLLMVNFLNSDMFEWVVSQERKEGISAPPTCYCRISSSLWRPHYVVLLPLPSVVSEAWALERIYSCSFYSNGWSHRLV